LCPLLYAVRIAKEMLVIPCSRTLVTVGANYCDEEQVAKANDAFAADFEQTEREQPQSAAKLARSRPQANSGSYAPHEIQHTHAWIVGPVVMEFLERRG
jgi:hypothetical protein